MVRRLRLAPGEAMPWRRDPFHRTARYTCAASRAMCANSNEEAELRPDNDDHRAGVAGADHRRDLKIERRKVARVRKLL